MNGFFVFAVGIVAVFSGLLPAQVEEAEEKSRFQGAAEAMQGKLAESLEELSRFRDQVTAEKLPMSRELSGLEDLVSELRRELAQRSRALDASAQDLQNLQAEIKALEMEGNYISNALGDYTREFESRLHIAEAKRYEEALKTLRLAGENTTLSKEDLWQVQAEVFALSIRRIEDALGGVVFSGSAVGRNGVQKHGEFLLMGGAALFRSNDGSTVGTAEQRLGSLEPAVIPFADPEDAAAAERLFLEREGFFPFDPTLGNAHRMESLQETFLDHVKKGGPVMVPIFAMAGLALLVALYKWGVLSSVRSPGRKQLAGLLAAVGRNDMDDARDRAQSMKGPIGKMLRAGAEHLHEPKELVEEVLYEKVLTSKLKLQSMLPFIAICAASAPLLGLLGTVTGIINTFKIITEFGSGDVKSLSGGISEALITTKFGLIVAIPSLLLHAYLSRKARAVIAGMETTAVAFVNHMSLSPRREGSPGAPAGGGTAGDRIEEQVREALVQLLGPSYREKLLSANEAEGRPAAGGKPSGEFGAHGRGAPVPRTVPAGLSEMEG